MIRNLPAFGFLLLMLISISLLSGCRSTQPRGAQNQVEQRLLQQFEQWRGVPYRLGGITTSGVDCSAFVQNVYRDGFNVNIPRTTGEQMNAGVAVNPRQLMIGDLVFFRTGRNTLHVGIVMRNGRFMHASTSQGVIMDDLNQQYWRDRFIRARRVL
ncbi:MAG: NlpC/P60 family protein [Balneolia bacterium]|nr:NlpC/P60 family protein [Balneolia bacterium]